MKKIKKIVFLISIITICILALMENKVNAMDVKEAGTHIANYAINCAKYHSTEFKYYWSDSDRAYSEWVRSEAYYGRKVDGYYTCDCAGFVNFVVHNAIGLNMEDYGLSPAAHRTCS